MSCDDFEELFVFETQFANLTTSACFKSKCIDFCKYSDPMHFVSRINLSIPGSISKLSMSLSPVNSINLTFKQLSSNLNCIFCFPNTLANALINLIQFDVYFSFRGALFIQSL